MKKLLLVLLLTIPATAQEPRAVKYTGAALLACRDLISKDHYTPSTITPTIVNLESAFNHLEKAFAVKWGVSSLNGFGFPAPAITDSHPIKYERAELAMAVQAYSAALASASTLPNNADADVDELLKDISIASSDAAKSEAMANSVPMAEEKALASLYEASFDLSQEEILTVQDIGQNTSSSATLALGWFAGVEWIRVLCNIAFNYVVQDDPSLLLVTRNGLDCVRSPTACAANLLLFPGVDALEINGVHETHGVPYYFRSEMLIFSGAVMSNADAVATLKFHPRAWSATDDAGYRLAILPNSIP